MDAKSGRAGGDAAVAALAVLTGVVHAFDLAGLPFSIALRTGVLLSTLILWQFWPVFPNQSQNKRYQAIKTKTITILALFDAF